MKRDFSKAEVKEMEYGQYLASDSGSEDDGEEECVPNRWPSDGHPMARLSPSDRQPTAIC